MAIARVNPQARTTQASPFKRPDFHKVLRAKQHSNAFPSGTDKSQYEALRLMIQEPDTDHTLQRRRTKAISITTYFLQTFTVPKSLLVSCRSSHGARFRFHPHAAPAGLFFADLPYPLSGRRLQRHNFCIFLFTWSCVLFIIDTTFGWSMRRPGVVWIPAFAEMTAKSRNPRPEEKPRRAPSIDTPAFAPLRFPHPSRATRYGFQNEDCASPEATGNCQLFFDIRVTSDERRDTNRRSS